MVIASNKRFFRFGRVIIDAIQGLGVAAGFCSSFLTVTEKTVHIRGRCLMTEDHRSIKCSLELWALMGMTVLRNYDLATF